MVRTSLIIALVCACPGEPRPLDAGPGNPLLDGGTAPAVDGGARPSDSGPPRPAAFPSCEACMPVRCTTQDDCRDGERCLETGHCAVGDCWQHNDCQLTQRCFQSRCVERPEAEHGLLLERRMTEPFLSHFGYEMNGYGIGLALLDYDGDGDLDLYLASNPKNGDGSPACLYQNHSTPGQVRFRAVERFCQHHDAAEEQRSNASAIDLEGDGFHELLIMGPRTLLLQRFYPEEEQINLLSKVPRSDRRGYCFAGAALAHDFNYDGFVDLYVGCQADSRSQNHPEMRENLLFLQTPEGSLEPEERDAWYLLNDDGSSLAIGALDFNDDGLLDIPMMNDTFTSPLSTQVAYDLNPGSIFWRCSPLDELCVYESQRFARGDDAWGSFMGIGHLYVEGVGPHLYISEWGPNRLVGFDGRSPVDRAEQSRVAVGVYNNTWIYSWGVVVDDWNRDGLEDLFVSQGIVPGEAGDLGGADHRNLVLLQGPDARFSSYGEEIGISVPSHVDAMSDEVVHSARATVKLDLDYDGYIDLVTAPNQGVFLHHAEVPIRRQDSPRCTLVPRPRLVPTFGTGYGLLPEGEERLRNWDIQGQLFMNTSPWILTPYGRGILQFPSGARVPYDCQGGPGPVEVVEPDWIQVQFLEGEARIQLDAPWLGESPTLTAAYKDPAHGPSEGQLVNDGHEWVLPFTREEAFMISFNGRWLARWWQP